MGTRADFYVGRGPTAEWLGSIGYDGFPDRGWPKAILKLCSEEAYREGVAKILAECDSATTPDQGWPWPWEDSRTTDYAYAFDGGHVWGSSFGGEWFDAREPEPEGERQETAIFPNMKERQRITYGKRSGALFLRFDPGASE